MMRCLVVDYSDDQDNTVNVVVRGVSLAGLPLTVNGDGLLQDVHRSGFYSIRYGFGVPFQGTLTTIIDTDYDDYAVVYSCTNSLLSGVFHSEYIWVLSRSGKISNPTRQNIYEKLDRLQINRSGLTMSDRSTCPTNSSTVARESDKDLASQVAQSAPSSPSSSSASGVESSGAPVVGGSGSDKVANLEKVNPEPQKSVVVPLLYDLPSPASSSSVGGSAKAGSSKAPPAPVENKVPQLPLSSSVSNSQLKQAAAAAAAAASVNKQSAAVSQQSAQVAKQQSQVQVVNAQQQPAQPVQVQQVQQQQQQQQQAQQQQPSLLAKIQQKP